MAEIAELDKGVVRVWPGNYSAYVVARQLELERQRQAYVTQQKEIERLEEAVRRFRHWAHIRVNERAAKQARVKQMQIDRMEKVERPVFERRRMALALRSGTRGGQRVLALEGVDATYGDEPVLLDVELVVMRGERVGVVGPNGGGKTTLLRIVASELEPAAGTVWTGDGITLGYLSQAAGALRDEDSLVDALRAGRSMAEDTAVRLLMGFLFDYEQCRRPVGTLSGGERTRLAFLGPDAGRAELPRARRAHQPPRHRLDRSPGGRLGTLRRHGHRRVPRPLLPGPHRGPHRARRRRVGAGLRGRLVRQRRRRAGGGMIARSWRGAVKPSDAEAYAAYIDETGMQAYAATPGNRGAWMLQRPVGELMEFVTFSLWDSIEAIKAFAGEDYETAVFYPEDDRFLVERDEKCHHWEVVRTS